MESYSFPPSPKDLGRIVGGRYRLETRIGTGSFAEVFRATPLAMGGTCAVKLLRREHAGNQEIRARFSREVKLHARVRHRNIVHVFDAGEDGDDKQLYMVMPLLIGETLRTILKYRRTLGPLPWLEGVSMICDLLNAVDALHAGGVLHRDLKPANTMSTPGEKPGSRTLMLLDLGLSTMLREPSIQPSGNLGSPLYRAPECWRGEPASVASDLYSIGVMLYEALTAFPPFEEGNLGRQHLEGEVPPLHVRQRNAIIPEPIKTVTLRALSKRPEDRYPSARAFFEALGQACDRVLYRLPPGYHLVPRKLIHATPDAVNEPTTEVTDPAAATPAAAPLADPVAAGVAAGVEGSPASSSILSPASSSAAPSAGSSAAAAVAPAPRRRRRAPVAALGIAAVGLVALVVSLQREASPPAKESERASPTSRRALPTAVEDEARAPELPRAHPIVDPGRSELAPPPLGAKPAELPLATDEHQPLELAPKPDEVRQPPAELAPNVLAATSSRPRSPRPSPPPVELTKAAVSAALEGASVALRSCPGVPRGWVVLGLRIEGGRATLRKIGLREPDACAQRAVRALRFAQGAADFTVSLRL